MTVAEEMSGSGVIYIDGKAVAARVREEIAVEVKELAVQGQDVGLAVILVGDDPASHVYVRNKVTACEKAGIKSYEFRKPADVSQDELLEQIEALNKDDAVHGILLQLPVPDHLDTNALIEAIDPSKDVDGLHPQNAGLLMAGRDGFVPCTPQGSLILIQEIEKNLSGLHAVIIGRSLLFGKPMGQILLSENCTVTHTHSRTKDLPSVCAQADILIAAVGQPEMVKADWVKPGAIVIDVGINRIDHPEQAGKTKLVGDVDTADVAKLARAITPVPGGVGPMTIACLLRNTLKSAKSRL